MVEDENHVHAVNVLLMSNSHLFRVSANLAFHRSLRPSDSPRIRWSAAFIPSPASIICNCARCFRTYAFRTITHSFRWKPRSSNRSKYAVEHLNMNNFAPGPIHISPNVKIGGSHTPLVANCRVSYGMAKQSEMWGLISSIVQSYLPSQVLSSQWRIRFRFRSDL
jgi:hypothetical protein